MQSAYSILSTAAYPTVQYVYSLSQKRRDYRKVLLKLKFVSIFSTILSK
jgi:hypothetical protein